MDSPTMRRAQGAFITNSEINRLVDYWKAQDRPENLVDIKATPIEDEVAVTKFDTLTYQAAEYVVDMQEASTSKIQAKFGVGHPRATKIMDTLLELRIIGPKEGTKPRRVLQTPADLAQIATSLKERCSDTALV